MMTGNKTQTTGNETMNKFFSGQELSNSSLGDHSCIFAGKVIKRTAKTVTIETDEGVKRCKIFTDRDGGEYIYPFGRYSMATIFRA